jgi:formylglycine-generating enzyme required for sulfatase activity/predicted Ser/Thr protein kinase
VDAATQSALVDFLARFLADRQSGCERPLAEYLALYPGCEAEIAREYLGTTEDGAASRDGLPQPEDALPRAGPYRLIREIGRGGQGVVWLAEDPRLGRRVALKLAPRSPSTDDLTPRLRREAQAASRLDHPGLCAVYDVGADERHAWIAMRFVEGQTLDRWIADQAQARERGEPGADPLLVARWIELAARALHEAHERGIVHRDVKPANLMITPAGDPVVLDFGIARESDGGAPLTLTGEALGTPAYMSPEQLHGGRDGADRRTDVWSLGATLYEALTLRRPFEAPAREVLVRMILASEPPDPRSLEPAIPRDLATVALSALTKELDRRYPSALALAEDLRRVRQREPIRARPAGVVLRLRRWIQRNPKLAASLAALFVVLAGALAVTSNLLARTRRTLGEKEALLGDVTQLADQTLARSLLEEERELWPASEARLGDLERWLASARELIDRRGRHAAAREGIAERTDLDPDPARNAAARDWFLAQLEELLGALDRLEATLPEIEARRAFAASVRVRSLEGPRQAWELAIAEVAADARYGGLVLAPQVGLVPLGADPRSGLQEFAHLASGEPARRAPDSGELSLEDATGIVLVLIPGSELDVGCELPGDARPPGSPNADAWTARWDGPVRRVALDPCFLSKYEMTQAQWERHTGSNPSAYSEGSRFIETGTSGLHPVEQVEWTAAERVLRELELELPTEARWEHGARAGTATPWFTGSERSSLSGHANLADDWARTHEGAANWTYEPDFDDGHTVHAQVGSLLPNPFGLHDVAGNVAEWCLDGWEDRSKVDPRPGDGLFEGSEPSRAVRGGSFTRDAREARSAYRDGLLPNAAPFYFGVRPARSLRP